MCAEKAKMYQCSSAALFWVNEIVLCVFLLSRQVCITSAAWSSLPHLHEKQLIYTWQVENIHVIY